MRKTLIVMASLMLLMSCASPVYAAGKLRKAASVVARVVAFPIALGCFALGVTGTVIGATGLLGVHAVSWTVEAIDPGSDSDHKDVPTVQE